MSNIERAVKVLGDDIVETWMDLHNEAKSLRVNAKSVYEQSIKLEKMIDHHLQMLNDQVAKFPSS
jgi:hypothetical protein